MDDNDTVIIAVYPIILIKMSVSMHFWEGTARFENCEIIEFCDAELEEEMKGFYINEMG